MLLQKIMDGYTFYIQPDEVFHRWWTAHKHRPPIPPGYVLCIKYALQGHPAAARLWEKTHQSHPLQQTSF